MESVTVYLTPVVSARPGAVRQPAGSAHPRLEDSCRNLWPVDAAAQAGCGRAGHRATSGRQRSGASRVPALGQGGALAAGRRQSAGVGGKPWPAPGIQLPRRFLRDLQAPPDQRPGELSTAPRGGSRRWRGADLLRGAGAGVAAAGARPVMPCPADTIGGSSTRARRGLWKRLSMKRRQKIRRDQNNHHVALILLQPECS